MFSQHIDVTSCYNLESCPNKYSENVLYQSINQDCKMVWQQSPQNAGSSCIPGQKNAILNQLNASNNSNTNRNPVVFETFRKEASVADWEAYLLSPPTSNSVNNVIQNPGNAVRSENTQNSTKFASTKANHRAHISFVPTSDGVFKPIVKRKRKRTTFTTEQVEALEAIFYKRPYVSREDRQVLMEQIQVSDKAIKVWFQNRRLKVKREREEQEMESSDSETTEETKPLAYVESQIYNADEHGYVTLDDRALNELVNVIDNYIPKDADLSCSDSAKSESENTSCSVSESEYSAIYEPISPPDNSDTTSQEAFTQKWEPFEAIEPKKSLQNLLDVHNFDYNELYLPVF